MAEGFKHPKTKVHVGDGFKFLEDYKNEFDVIITDSSDPEGPAESLFQKSYFELLFGALKEGGVITTQGCRFTIFVSPRFTSRKLKATCIFMWEASLLTVIHLVLQRLTTLLLLHFSSCLKLSTLIFPPFCSCFLLYEYISLTYSPPYSRKPMAPPKIHHRS